MTSTMKEKLQYDNFRIDEICNIIKGKTPTMKAIPGKFPLVVTADKRKTCNEYQINGDATCIPLVSSTGHWHASIKRIHHQSGKFALANIMVALIPKDTKRIFSKYLYYLFNTKKEEYFVSLMAGTANVSLKIKDIERIIILLPPINEQKRIVSKIEELFLKINFIKKSLEDTKLQLKQFRKSLFESALEGKLTKKWRERNECGINSINKNEKLPKGWTKTKLGEICELIGGGTPSRNNPEYFNGNIIWLTPTEISKNKIIEVNDSREKITDLGLKKSSAKIIPINSVLLTSRASIGNVAIAGSDVTTNQGFASFVCSKILYNYFLAYWLWGKKNFLESRATGTIFKEISKSKLRELEIDVPSLNEQKQIVSQIEHRFSFIENTEKITISMLSQLDILRSNILKQAFSGKLVN